MLFLVKIKKCLTPYALNKQNKKQVITNDI